jgi:hypothetical protein
MFGFVPDVACDQPGKHTLDCAAGGKPANGTHCGHTRDQIVDIDSAKNLSL